MVGAIGQLLN